MENILETGTSLSVEPGEVCFVTLVRSLAEVRQARLMVESLRNFGGQLSGCPVWMFTLASAQINDGWEDLDGVTAFQLDLCKPLPDYYFATKVLACAQAEELAGPGMRTLVWLNPQSLVIQPPLLCDLSPDDQAAFRPVHIRNIGSLAQDPLDGFWRSIYDAVGLDDEAYLIRSFLDDTEIRPYFNTHLFSVNPNLGLLKNWLEVFCQLVEDKAFQTKVCADELHQIFLHQAVLSALVIKVLPQADIRMLPAGYSYPLHLHSQAPASRKVASLDELILPVYEDDGSHPLCVQGLEISTELRTWLTDRSSHHITNITSR